MLSGKVQQGNLNYTVLLLTSTSDKFPSPHQCLLEQAENENVTFERSSQYYNRNSIKFL